MKKTLLVAIAVMGLAACDGAGSNFTGQWVNVKNDCLTLDVAENGANFIVKVDIPSFLGPIQTLTTVGKLTNELLEIELGQVAVPFTYSKSTGTLITKGDEYKRDSGESKRCKAKKL